MVEHAGLPQQITDLYSLIPPDRREALFRDLAEMARIRRHALDGAADKQLGALEVSQ